MSLAGIIRTIRSVFPAAKAARPPRFSDLAFQYSKRLERHPAVDKPHPGKGARIGVLVTPWLCTPVPFFSLECALMLAREGQHVTLLWDQSNVFFNCAKANEIEAVHGLVQQAAKWFPIIDVGNGPEGTPAQSQFLDLLLFENAVRQLKGERNAQQFLERNAALVLAMRAHAGRIEAMLKEQRFDWILVPGGVWAVSGVYAHIAEQLKIPFSTFDSGVGSLFVAHDGAAAHFGDIPKAFEVIRSRTEPSNQRALQELARGELRKRMEGRDAFQLQPQPSGQSADPKAKCDILVPLNYRSDTAALCRQRLFGSVTEWLKALLEWASARGDVTVAVRQHPCERIPEYRGSDDWAQILAPFAGMGDRLRFIGAADPVNTYDLLENASVVLPFTSRVGIEASMLGKPVILGTHCYYEDCGFVQRAGSIEEYFQMVDAALGGGLKPTESQQGDAALVYYLAERCLGLATGFTPQPSDYLKWVETPVKQLWAMPANEDLRSALISRQPVALLQHQRLAIP